jgi:1,4-dihydroxy-6-naphthoate synthase
MQTITLGFSSCPNDTFIFDAMIHHKIDTECIEFECIIEDVEQLNRRAFEQQLDVTKISFNAFTHLVDHYVLLDSGAALGENCGPLVIAKKPLSMHQLEGKTIAIPGKNTTANLLLSLAFPQLQNKKEMLFSDIEQAVLKGEVDAGLIIHESRFTYAQKGLQKIMDLGEHWENTTASPTPLGGIIAHRKLNKELIEKINRVLHRSVAFAFANPKSGLEFIRLHSQEMSEEVMYQHIALYVNHYSLLLGAEGRKAIELLFETSIRAGFIAKPQLPLFVDAL